MPKLMPYGTWLQQTNVDYTVRSPELKQLDMAYLKYEQIKNRENFRQLKTAMTAWKNSKGPMWSKSKRNRNGAISVLNSLLFPDPQRIVTYEERKREKEAIAFVKRESAKSLSKLLAGRQVVFKEGLMGKSIGAVKRTVKKTVNDLRGKPTTVTVPQVYKQPRNIRGNLKEGASESAFSVATTAPFMASNVKSVVENWNPEDRERPGSGAADTVRDVSNTIQQNLVGGVEKFQSVLSQAKDNLDGIARSAEQVFLPIMGKVKSKLYSAIYTGIVDVMADTLAEFAEQVVTEFLTEVIADLGEIIADIVVSVAPYVCLATSTFKTVKDVKNIAMEGYDLYTVNKHKHALRSGDPNTALRSLRNLLEDELAMSSKLLALHSTELLVKVAGQVGDAVTLGAPSVSVIVNPITGIVSSLISLGLQFYSLAKDIEQKITANKILTGETILSKPIKIFEICPILGCYYLTCVDTSVLVNCFFEDMIRTGGSRIIIQLNSAITEHIHPILTVANERITNSRLTLTGAEALKGVVAARLQSEKMFFGLLPDPVNIAKHGAEDWLDSRGR